jgi:hydrogenase nickel incorporation protein HypA/HybF
MHEYAMTESMFTLALEKAGEANARRINRINMVLGELSGIDDTCVSFYFDFMRKDTIASGAELSFVKVPLKLHCRNCRKDFLPEKNVWTCPDCRKADVDIISGRECYMESIEVD